MFLLFSKKAMYDGVCLLVATCHDCINILVFVCTYSVTVVIIKLAWQVDTFKIALCLISQHYEFS